MKKTEITCNFVFRPGIRQNIIHPKMTLAGYYEAIVEQMPYNYETSISMGLVNLCATRRQLRSHFHDPRHQSFHDLPSLDHSLITLSLHSAVINRTPPARGKKIVPVQSYWSIFYRFLFQLADDSYPTLLSRIVDSKVRHHKSQTS